MTRVKGLGSQSVLQAIARRKTRSTHLSQPADVTPPATTSREEEETVVEAAEEGEGDENEEDESDENEEDEEGDEDGEEEGGEEEDEFCVDDELQKLEEPPPILTRADFTALYGFVDDGEVPHRLSKWNGQPFDDSKCVALFGEPVGKDGRYGYSWKDVKSKRIQKRIKELLQALYQRDRLRGLLPHKVARGIVLEEEKVLVNWAACGEETNKTQRQAHARNLIRLQKMKEKVKEKEKVDPNAWRKLHVDPRELQSEVCEGRGSSMGGKILEEQECNSRLDYVGRLLAVENIELEARVDAERQATTAKESHAESLKHHLGVLNIMKVKQKRYEKQLRAASMDGTVDSKLTEKVNTYNDLVRGVRKKVKRLEKSVAGLDETLSLESQRVAMMRMQVRALQEEHTHLGRIVCGFHMRPLPLVYVAGEAESAGVSIEVGDCSLCGFSFPHSEIIVTACKHLYHPWCALVNFTEGTECCVVGCKQVQPIEWIMSFGWRGVRGCGRPGGGSEEWTKMTLECANAITIGLAARSDAATEFRRAVKQSQEGNIIQLCTDWYNFVLIGTYSETFLYSAVRFVLLGLERYSFFNRGCIVCIILS